MGLIDIIVAVAAVILVVFTIVYNVRGALRKDKTCSGCAHCSLRRPTDKGGDCALHPQEKAQKKTTE